MDVLNKVAAYAGSSGDRIALTGKAGSMSYRELENGSNRLASYIKAHYPGKDPLVVYGHKSPLMPLCFLACAKAGHAYCPVDISVPEERLADILEQTGTPVLFCADCIPDALNQEVNPGQDENQEESRALLKTKTAVLHPGEIRRIVEEYPVDISSEDAVQGDDTVYIIFTSGSTGRPKGVEISIDNLNHYLDWSVNLGSLEQEKEGKRFLNQAPFSFDLSVMDLYTCFCCGGTLCMLDRETQGNYAALFETIFAYNPAVWVSTPSFAEICLADPKFTQDNLPGLTMFLFCGETLTGVTAGRLLERFPGVCLMNTYGPTESTVAVSEIRITPELVRNEALLPVGSVKQGSEIRIVSAQGELLPEGEKGEIVILGDTVAKGYFRRKDLTELSFFEIASEDGKKLRGYHTGDQGFLKSGILYCCGREDGQIKLHGYRIELGDIENNLLGFPGITRAVVLPRSRDGKVTSLQAFVAMEDADTAAEKERVREIKTYLMSSLPEYMIPKKIRIFESLPVTPNGKVDRRSLKEMLS